jgi:hypothetical protein
METKRRNLRYKQGIRIYEREYINLELIQREEIS